MEPRFSRFWPRHWHENLSSRPAPRWALITLISISFLFIALMLMLANTNLLRGLVETIASAKLNRDIRIEGEARLSFSLAPTLTLGKIKIGNPEWAGKEQMGEIEHLRVQARLLPLLIGRVILPQVDIENPDLVLLRDRQGRANWSFADENGAQKSSDPMSLPLIRHFSIRDGKLKITDEERKLTFQGSIASYEVDTQKERRFQLVGRGLMNGKPFNLTLSGEPLLNIRADTPYPFTADLSAGNTRIKAQGAISEPFDLARFDMSLRLTGNDLADLFYLTGLALPNTPPYSLNGKLERHGSEFRFEKFSGKVGDSDLSGDLKVETAGERPRLTATLKSNRLDFDDLGALFGAPPATESGETASTGQKEQSKKMRAAQRLLPDAPLQIERVRAMDAKVHYEARSVNAPDLPLEKVTLDLSLEQGVLSLKPVSFSFPQGRLFGNVTIDARGNTPKTNLDMRLSEARLEEFVGAKPNEKPALEGAILARARLEGSGDSVHKTASTANGTLTFVVPRGEIRQAFAELLGVNITTGLALLLSDSEEQTSLRCAVADFEARNGILHAKTVVLDTKVTLATGKGTIDLKSEKLDLRLEGAPKKARIRAIAPITVKGSLRSPSIGVDPAATAAQAGLAAALGILLTPVAAVLPFVDPGLEDNADCRALMQEARKSGGETVAPARLMPKD